MSAITLVNKSPRLTETEVHEAAQSLIDESQVVSSLSLLRILGRGSLTTITKYMSSFNRNNTDLNNLTPSFTEIPESLARSTRLLAIKIWAESQEIANKELESQREVLQQAVKVSTDRVKEAEIFSDEQTKRLEEIERNYEEKIEELKTSLTTVNIEFDSKVKELNQKTIELEIIKNDNATLNKSLSDTKDLLDELKSSSKSDLSEIKMDFQLKIEDLKLEIKQQSSVFQAHEDSFSKEKTKLITENKQLDLQVAKQQISLDLISNRLNDEKAVRWEESKENKMLREKSSLLEGELNAWKQMNQPPKQTAKNSV
ncbi:MAG: hypothetical protein GQ532_19145 [Methylomarinum sp.]|nr:hypothetical protein [Methylomarinum sp.]